MVVGLAQKYILCLLDVIHLDIIHETLLSVVFLGGGGNTPRTNPLGMADAAELDSDEHIVPGRLPPLDVVGADQARCIEGGQGGGGVRGHFGCRLRER